MSPLFVGAVWLLAFQDPTPIEILEKADAALRDARGSSVTFKHVENRAYLLPVQIDDAGAVKSGRVVASRDGLYVQGGGGNPVRFTSLEKFSIGASAPTAFLSDRTGSLIQALAPLQSVTLEQGLRVQGRQIIEGEDCWVLVSHRPVRYVPQWNNTSFGCGTGRIDTLGFRVRHFISVRTFHLARIEDRSITDPPGHSLFQITDFKDWNAGVPGRILYEHYTEGCDGNYREEFVIDSRRRELIPAGSLTPPTDALVATRGWDPTVEAALGNSPEDPDYLYSAAIQWTRTERRDFRMPVDAREASGRLERALAQRWSDEAAGMLVAFQTHDKNVDGLARTLDKIRKRPRLSSELRCQVAECLIKSGKPDEALEWLDRNLPDAESWAGLRVSALDASGKLEEALKEAAAARGHLRGVDSYNLFRQSMQLRRGAFEAALEGALKEHPKSAFLHGYAIGLHSGKDPERHFQALNRALTEAVTPSIEPRILEGFRLYLTRPYLSSHWQLAPERIRELKDAFLQLLDRLEPSAVPLALRAIILRSCGDGEGGRKALAGAIDRVRDWNGYPGNFGDLTGLLLGEAEQLEDMALWERALSECIKAAIRLKWGYTVIQPPYVGAFIKKRLEGRTAHRLYHDFKCAPRMIQESHVLGADLQPKEAQLATGAIVEEARKNPRDTEGHLWLAKMIESQEARGEGFYWKASSLEFYESALGSDPDNLDALVGAARRRWALKDFDAARDHQSRLLRLIESGRKPPAGVSAAGIRIQLADAYDKSGQSRQVQELLSKGDFTSRELQPSELWTTVELCAKHDRLDRALEAAQALLDRGYRPYIAIAEIRGRMKNFVEQMRALNRGMEDGVDQAIDPARHWTLYKSTWKTTVEELKRHLLENLGSDYFIGILIASPAPALSSTDEAKARALSDRLEKVDRVERAEILSGLRKLGRGVVPLISGHLKSSDENLRHGVRAILSEWSEPR